MQLLSFTGIKKKYSQKKCLKPRAIRFFECLSWKKWHFFFYGVVLATVKHQTLFSLILFCSLIVFGFLVRRVCLSANCSEKNNSLPAIILQAIFMKNYFFYFFFFNLSPKKNYTPITFSSQGKKVFTVSVVSIIETF